MKVILTADVAPPAFVVSERSGEMPPTVPLKLVAPVVFTVSAHLDRHSPVLELARIDQRQDDGDGANLRDQGGDTIGKPGAAALRIEMTDLGVERQRAVAGSARVRASHREVDERLGRHRVAARPAGIAGRKVV